MGANSAPIDYVVRRDKPAGWDPDQDATNEHEKLRYQLPLAGPKFASDSKVVFGLVNDALIGTEGATWVEEVANKNCGRMQYLRLVAHYEGDAQLSRRATAAKADQAKTYFRGHANFSFESFLTVWTRSYRALEKRGEVVLEDTETTKLLAKIQVP